MLTLSGAGQPQNGVGIEERFVISVKTDNAGTSADNEFTLPWIGTYDVDWGDGVVETGLVDTQTHTYASAGTYDVKVTAVSGKIEFRYVGDPLKLLDIKNWGTCQWTSLQNSFFECKNITNISAIDTPDFSIMNNLKFSFYNCSNLISMDVSTWDVSNVIEAEVAFQSCVNLETLNGIENWTFQVLNINGLKSTFRDCRKFNSNIGGWTYVGPILENVLNNCDMFNHSLANWDLTTVNFGSPIILPNATGISQANYDETLISWASQSLPSNKTLNMGGSQYSYEAAAARQTLIDTYGWTITDGGQAVAPEFAIRITTSATTNGSSNADQFKLPLISSGTYNALVDWGDGTSDLITQYDQAETLHTYSTVGDYEIRITGVLRGWRLAFSGDRFKIRDIKNWGILDISNSRAFEGTGSALVVTATDAPIISTNDLSYTFSACYSIRNIGDLSKWNPAVTGVTNMSGFFLSCYIFNEDITFWTFPNSINVFKMFDNAKLFNQNISVWNTQNFNNVQYLFHNAESFNQDITSWDLSGVTSLDRFFGGRTFAFNQDISLIDLSTITDIGYMFYSKNYNFDLRIDLWDVSSITRFQALFYNSVLTVNPNIENWDTSSATNMSYMFLNCQNFDMNLSNWNIANVTTLIQFARSTTTWSTANYDATLIGWAAQAVNSNLVFEAGNAQYTLGGAAEAARNTLINTYGWTITDGGGIFVGLLDTYPNASAAYSLRDLASASVGSAVVRVRRSSDNTEQDFTSAEITDGTLTTFTGANNGFVTTWYDQSGNSNNAVQSTAIEQPKLVSSGVVELENGKPCIIWDNTNDRMQINTSYSGNNLLSIFSVYNKTTPNPSDDTAYLVFADGSLNVPDGVLAWRWGGQLGAYRSGAHSVNGSIPYDAQVNSNFIYRSTQVDFYNNSTLIGSKTASNAIANFDYTFIQIGRTGGNTSFKNQELIIYPSDQSANRTGIETNINTEYTIY